MTLSRGSLEMLAIVDNPGISGRARMLCLLEGLLGRRHRTARPVVARRRHLRALGLVERTRRGAASSSRAKGAASSTTARPRSAPSAIAAAHRVLPTFRMIATLRRYLGQTGRLRPDVTVIVDAPPRPARAVVIEAKLSADPSYLAQGLQEAFLYRVELATHLSGWPKAILVASSRLPGEPRREDDVIAVGWDRWAPASVIEGLVEGLVAAREDGLR